LPGAALGFGKKYPEFWINKREAMGQVADERGVHICLLELFRRRLSQYRRACMDLLSN
jgi:hypothetical protein